MELDSLIQAFQGELRAIASLRKQEAEHVMSAANLVGKITYEARHSDSTSHPTFPENDYGTIASQVINNPKYIKKRKWATESWSRYAIRISKWVKWSVDDKALKAAIELQQAN